MEPKEVQNLVRDPLGLSVTLEEDDMRKLKGGSDGLDHSILWFGFTPYLFD
jgi:hypothetical protein